MAFFSKKQPEVPKRRQADASHASERATEENLRQRYAFKRNQTLTGSASSHVASTNESNAHLKSNRVHVHDLALQRRRISGILLIVVAAVLVLAGLVWQFTAESVVRTSDVTVTLDQSYTQAIDEYFARQPIERLRFLLNKEALTTYLHTVTPEVLSVSSEGAVGLGKSLFVLEMRRPIAGWSIRGVQQYVDTTGTSFVRNYHQKPSVQVIDNSGIQIDAGQAVASNQFLGFVGRVVGLANAKQHQVTQVIIPQGTTRQIELQMNQVDYPVKMSVDRSAGEQVEDMSRAMRWLSTNSKTPEYLDVRVSGRAFYR